MDAVDIAGDTVLTCNAEAESRARGKSGPQSHPDFDGEHCVGDHCGEPIPAARLALGRVFCVYCQELLERK